MTIPLPPITELDSTLVSQNLLLLDTMLNEDVASLDTALGPLRDLILRPSAAFAVQRQTQLTSYLQARSLLDVTNNPALADTDTVDAIVSNFDLTRPAGSAASGTVTLTFTSNTTVLVSQSTLFTAGNQTYAVSQTYTAKAKVSQVLAAGDVLFQALPGGKYAFTIPVTATLIGSAGNIAQGTALTPSASWPAFVGAVAGSAFTGGSDPASNATLLQQLSSGAAAKSISNRATMTAFLPSLPGFSGVLAQSIVGYGDPEMQRDRHWLWPVSGGGRVDWYVRTQALLVSTLLPGVTATLIQKTEDGFGLWQFSIGRNTAPAFYEVSNIVPAGTTLATGFSVVNDLRSIDLTPPAANYLVPDVIYLVEGVYSRFQAAVIQFKDTDTLTHALSLGATQTYDVTVVGMPLIDQIQDTVAGRNYASYGCDCLVRAPVPCFVSLSFTVYQPAGTAAPDLSAVATAVCQAVNNTGFTGALYASGLAAAVHGALAIGQTVSAIAMTGVIRHPDGGTTTLESTEVLTVPDDPSAAVTANTVQFFVTPSDVTIEVVSA